MLTNYNLKMPHVVYSGRNAIRQILVKGKYKKVVIFTDEGVVKAGILEGPLEILKECAEEVELIDNLPSEPTCDQVQKIVDIFKMINADFIIAIGGGSVMDIAKLASIAATDEYSIRDLIDNPTQGKKTVPTLMIPTTAGTGSEATPNSIVTVPEKEIKVGIVNNEMIADAVILDGELIRDLPKKIAASTGIDALAHAIECYTSNKANVFSNLFAGEAFKLIIRNIEKACMKSDAIEEKTNMLIAAFYAGVAITASGTTAVHALSYPLGGKYHIPHGVSNAMMLMPVMRFNQEVCCNELSNLYDLSGFTGVVKDEEKANLLLLRMEELIKKLEIPTSLQEYGIGIADIEFLVNAGMDVKRLLYNNKKELTYEDAKRLYMEIM